MRLDWGTWLAGVVMCAALGVALLFVALWHYVYIIGKAVKSG